MFSLAFFALNPSYFFVQLSKQLDQQCSNSNFLFQLCNFPTKRIYKRQYILIQYLCKSHKKAKKRYMCLLRSQDILTPEGECGRWQDTDASPARKNVLLLYWQQKSIFGQFFSSLYCIRLKLPYFGDYIILGGWHTEQLCGNLPLQAPNQLTNCYVTGETGRNERKNEISLRT